MEQNDQLKQKSETKNKEIITETNYSDSVNSLKKENEKLEGNLEQNSDIKYNQDSSIKSANTENVNSSEANQNDPTNISEEINKTINNKIDDDYHKKNYDTKPTNDDLIEFGHKKMNSQTDEIKNNEAEKHTNQLESNEASLNSRSLENHASENSSPEASLNEPDDIEDQQANQDHADENVNENSEPDLSQMNQQQQNEMEVSNDIADNLQVYIQQRLMLQHLQEYQRLMQLFMNETYLSDLKREFLKFKIFFFHENNEEFSSITDTFLNAQFLKFKDDILENLKKTFENFDEQDINFKIDRLYKWNKIVQSNEIDFFIFFRDDKIAEKEIRILDPNFCHDLIHPVPLKSLLPSYNAMFQAVAEYELISRIGREVNEREQEIDRLIKLRETEFEKNEIVENETFCNQKEEQLSNKKTSLKITNTVNLSFGNKRNETGDKLLENEGGASDFKKNTKTESLNFTYRNEEYKSQIDTETQCQIMDKIEAKIEYNNEKTNKLDEKNSDNEKVDDADENEQVVEFKTKNQNEKEPQNNCQNSQSVQENQNLSALKFTENKDLLEPSDTKHQVITKIDNDITVSSKSSEIDPPLLAPINEKTDENILFKPLLIENSTLKNADRFLDFKPDDTKFKNAQEKVIKELKTGVESITPKSNFSIDSSKSFEEFFSVNTEYRVAKEYRQVFNKIISQGEYLSFPLNSEFIMLLKPNNSEFKKVPKILKYQTLTKAYILPFLSTSDLLVLRTTSKSCLELVKSVWHSIYKQEISEQVMMTRIIKYVNSLAGVS